MEPQDTSSLFAMLGYVLITVAGAILMVGGAFAAVRRFAWRLFWLGIFAAVVAAIGPQWWPGQS